MKPSTRGHLILAAVLAVTLLGLAATLSHPAPWMEYVRGTATVGVAIFWIWIAYRAVIRGGAGDAR